MINLLGSWQDIKANALKAIKMQVEWQSMVRIHKRYRLRAVMNDRLIIMKMDGSKDVLLTRANLEQALRRLNKCRGKIARGQLLPRNSARETALVLFHPRLAWSDDLKYIIEVKP